MFTLDKELAHAFAALNRTHQGAVLVDALTKELEIVKSNLINCDLDKVQKLQGQGLILSVLLDRILASEDAVRKMS